MKTLAIDIDGTWTADPWTFGMLKDLFEDRYWKVIFVTGAEQPKDKLRHLGIHSDVITCAPGQFKRDAAIAAGYDVTVWMDDQPGTIEPQRKLTEQRDDEL